MIKKDFRSLSSQSQETIRIKAVEAVRSGRGQGEVAHLFGVTRQAVYGWMRLARQKGTQALKARKRGRPAGGRLTVKQERWIADAIRDRCPDQLKLPFYLWTREAVVQLIQRRTNVSLSVWTVGRYLFRWGFTPQKPTRQAFEKNRREVRQWLAREYPAIRLRALREKAVIFWGDEMGMRSDHSAGRSYSPRGKTPVIPGTGKRFRCNMISAITNRGQMQFMVFRDSFTAPIFLTFLRRLLRQNRRKVFLILDAHPVHIARRVERWFKSHASKIHVFYLPGYSPELNPDEYLNQDVKTNAVGRTRAADSKELVGFVRSYLRTTQAHPGLVKRYFHHESVRYASV